MFSCKSNGHCIDYHYYCDGIGNCLDNSDEFNCHQYILNDDQNNNNSFHHQIAASAAGAGI